MGWPKEMILVRHGESVANAASKEKEKDSDYVKFSACYKKGKKRGFIFSAETIVLAKNLLKKYSPKIGQVDSSLTTEGRRQARPTGKALRGILEKPDVIVVTPYKRTWETLEQILGVWPELGECDVVIEPLLRDRDTGLVASYGDRNLFCSCPPVESFGS